MANLRAYLGVRRLTTATPEEVLSIYWIFAWHRCSIGIIDSCQILVDESILQLGGHLHGLRQTGDSHFVEIEKFIGSAGII